MRRDRIAIARVDVAITNVAKVEISKSNAFNRLEITIIRRRRTIEQEPNCMKCVSIVRFSFVKKEKFALIVIVAAFLALFKRRR